jgi:HD-GYP domain-containing protein (c-di-GMP phosphodiesterase class II)
MRDSRPNEDPEVAAPTRDDPLLTALRQAEARYREIYRDLHQQRAALSDARAENEKLSQKLAAQHLELEEERRRDEHHRERLDELATAFTEIHRALFSGNIYDLILKTCLTLTGATRGLYAIAAGQDDTVRVRAAVDIDGYPTSQPSPFITHLCQAVLQTETAAVYNDPSHLPVQPPDSEAFRNCVVAPVVLRSKLRGIVIVGDKVGGDFDDQDAHTLLSVGSHAAVAVENTRLQHEVQEAYVSLIGLLSEAITTRNPQMRSNHGAGSHLAGDVAEKLELSEYERSIVYYATLLHDIGNIGVSDGVLNKPGPLLDAERELIHAHAQIGQDLLREVPLLEPVAEVIRHHHERYDGSGYPDGLQGEDIPIAARIVAVADAYGAMLAARSYRPALTRDQACQELRRGAGTQFDPRVVHVFLAALDSTDQHVLDNEHEFSDPELPGLSARRVAEPDPVVS